MVESGFSSPRSDPFPSGLRVLVVDDDPTWLKILEKMLRKCSYEVTSCSLARDALNKLREKKDGYDIVISDVNMPDMDGFKLLEHVGLEMDLPVIMMSVDGETRRVMKGVQHGACDYLLKPIRMKELRNIWQHVFRKRIHEVRDIESLEGLESIHMTISGSDLSEDGHMFSREDATSVKKRKDAESRHDDEDFNDPSAKKARVVWSVDLHQKFVKAVNQIGLDKVGPKKILDLMNVPWLTRENVASHLQKYRLYLGRLQKENDAKSSLIGTKHADSPPKDSTGIFEHKNSTNMHQNDVLGGSYGFPVGNSLVQSVDVRGHEGDHKRNASVPEAHMKGTLSVDLPGPHKAKSSQTCFDDSFAPIDSGMNYTSFDHPIPSGYSLSEIAEIHFKQESKLLDLENCFNQLPLPDPRHHIQTEYLQSGPPISSGLSMTKREASSSIEAKPSYDEYNRGNHIKHFDSFPVQMSQSLNSQVFEPISATISNMKSQGFNLNCLTDWEWESVQRNIYWEVEAPFAPVLQGDCYAMTLGLQNIDFTEYSDFTEYIDPTPFAKVPSHLYDALSFDYEHLFDSIECPVINQGLFIA
ncbi:hypothetical protein SLA2020_126270 [Shorea laevis]